MTDEKYILIQSQDTYWRIPYNSPQLLYFKSNKNLALVNPLYYNTKSNNPFNNIIHNIVNVNSEYFFTANSLLFKQCNDEVALTELHPFLSQLIYQIRIISKQAALNPNTFFHLAEKAKSNNFQKYPKIMESPNIKMSAKRYSTSITWKMIEEADERINTNFQIPIYTEILTDAFGGLINHEFRKVILDSSIAIESLFAIRLNEDYEKIIHEKKEGIHRVSKFTTKDGEVFKDPIYQILKEKTSFSALLHERPLYIWNKSVLLENEPLYNAARDLYRTRNKIVHFGAPDPLQKNVLPINITGAVKAFDTARKLFNFVGIDEFDHLQFGGFIPVK